MKIFVLIAGCAVAASAQYQQVHQYASNSGYAAPLAAQQVSYAGPVVQTQSVPVANSYAQAPLAVAAPVAVAAPAAVAAPVAIASAPASPPRVHTIHTHSSRQQIRLEEYNAPNQVIRVHEAPQAAPQVLHVRAPASPQSIVRVISRSSGPAHVERVVHQAPGVQVINVHRPPPPPARIVQIVRAPATPPRVLFHQEADAHAEIRVEAPQAPAPLVAPVQAVPAQYQTVAVQAPATNTFVSSAPATSVINAPVPVGVGYTMYGVGYGRVYERHFTARASRA